jgi:lysophospholipase L1-like esterase
MKIFVWLIVLGATLGSLPVNGLAAENLFFPVIYNNYCPNQHLFLNFLAFGDSITGCYYDDYYGWIDGTPEFPGCGYERRVYDWLNAYLGFCPGKLAYYNYGWGGENTSAGLARFLSTITNPAADLHRLYPAGATVTAADLVIIMEGTNDINQGVDPFLIEANLSNMISQAKQAGKKVIIATIPPSFSTVYPQGQQSYLKDRIFELGLVHQVPVADVYSSLAGHPEYMDNVYNDGLHPNAAGFDQIATVMYWTILNNNYWTISDLLK